MENYNTREDLENIQVQVFELLRNIDHKPSVQIQTGQYSQHPPDYKIEDDTKAEADPDKRSEQDEKKVEHPLES